MSIQNDRWIIEMATSHGMIEPFEQSQVRDGVISYGVSSYGYDMRVAGEFRIFTNVLNSVVDPKHFDPKSFVEFEGDVCIVPPNSFALARSVEYFRIPRDVVTITVGKSTYARCGIITNVAVRARVGGIRDVGDLKHHAPASEDLRQRRHRAGPVLSGRRASHHVVPGQEREVSGADGSHAPQALAPDGLRKCPGGGGTQDDHERCEPAIRYVEETETRDGRDVPVAKSVVGAHFMARWAPARPSHYS